MVSLICDNSKDVALDDLSDAIETSLAYIPPEEFPQSVIHEALLWSVWKKRMKLETNEGFEAMLIRNPEFMLALLHWTWRIEADRIKAESHFCHVCKRLADGSECVCKSARGHFTKVKREWKPVESMNRVLFY